MDVLRGGGLGKNICESGLNMMVYPKLSVDAENDENI